MKKFITFLLVFSFFCISTAFGADIELSKKSTINSILARKELRVGVNAGYVPFEVKNKNGEIIGFDIDIANELADAMGVKLTLVNIDFKGLIPALLTDKVDILAAAMTITQERNLKISFSQPYLVIGQTVLLSKKLEGTVTSYEQLNDPKYNIVARQGTTSEIAVKKYLSRANLKTVDKETEGTFEVMNGRADAWVYDLPYNALFVSQKGADKVVHLDKPFTYEPLGLAIKQGDPDFLNFIDTFLRQLKNDGRYDALYEKWMKNSSWYSEIQQ